MPASLPYGASLSPHRGAQRRTGSGWLAAAADVDRVRLVHEVGATLAVATEQRQQRKQAVAHCIDPVVGFERRTRPQPRERSRDRVDHLAVLVAKPLRLV